MKAALIVILVIAILALGYWFIITRVNKVDFNPTFRNLDLSQLSLDNLIGGQASLQVQINTRITNMNNFPINISDFQIRIYHSGALIAESAATPANMRKVTVPANGLIDALHDVNVFVNRTILDIAKDAQAGQVKLDYTARFSIYGFPYTYNDYFMWNL